MSVDGFGDGLEGVHVSGNAEVVLGDEADDGKHGGASVTDFGLAEPRNEHGVGLGQVERIVLEFLAAEVDSADHVVPNGVGGDGGGAGAGLGRGEGGSRAKEGGEDGSRLHFYSTRT